MRFYVASESRIIINRTLIEWGGGRFEKHEAIQKTSARAQARLLAYGTCEMDDTEVAGSWPAQRNVETVLKDTA